jgi:predicted RNase H-like HicB family nuclease
MVVYPAIFTPAGSTVLIEVPDLEILTEASSLSAAIETARDAIGLKCISLEDDSLPVPAPSAPGSIDVSRGSFADDGVGFVSLVDIDLAAYRRRLDQKMVRRNVSIPAWMDREATAAHINVSRVLQSALSETLRSSPR